MARMTPELRAATVSGRSKRAQRAPAQLGRVTILTPEVSKKICDAIRAGAYLSVAARYAGVSYATLNTWLRKGAEATGPKDKNWIYRTLLEEVEEAEAQSEVAANLQWRSAWAKDWNAARVWLERRYPERYAANRDTTQQQVAMAGVNLTINTGSAASPAQSKAAEVSVPLEQLIEDNPKLLSATMHLFDSIDHIYAGNQPQDEPPVRQIPAPSDDDEIIEGDYTPVDDEATP